MVKDDSIELHSSLAPKQGGGEVPLVLLLSASEVDAESRGTAPYPGETSPHEESVRYQRTIWLTVLAAAIGFPAVVKADTCPSDGSASGFSGLPTSGSNCFLNTGVVYVDYGTLTLLAPDGSLISTTNIVTAETQLVPFDTTPTGVPAAFVELYPTLVGQLEVDPQSMYAEFPSWLYTGLTNLGDDNGFGFVLDPSAPLDEQPDALAFDADLASVSGPYMTLSDTGFQSQPFSPAGCAYLNGLVPGACPGPPGPGNSQYTFEYQLGPGTIGGNVYATDVNFEIFSRDVTEQLVATPEPAMLLPLGIGLAILGFVRRRKSKARPSGI